MVDAPRITVDDLHKRMEAGEDFTLIDTRNPQAWASDQRSCPALMKHSLGRWPSECGAEATLDVMEADALKMRLRRPFIFTNLKTGEGADQIATFVIAKGGFAKSAA